MAGDARHAPGGRPARAGSRPSAISPTCSTATRCTGRSCPRLGGRRRRPLAGRAVAAPARADRRARPGGAGGGGLRAAARRARRSWTCPARLSLFGLTRLPAAQLHVLRALAEHRDVHLFLLHPSPALWERIAAARAARDRAAPRTRRSRWPRNRLLASWGQDARELQLVLGPGRDHRTSTRSSTAPARCSPACRPPCARTGVAASRRGTDGSVEVHSCHGRARQVEVLRDAILHLLAEDPTLEPRDVIVMCPDIEAFAPLIQATFGAGESATRTTSCRTTACPTCASGSPTARCARRTRCSASSRGCWSSPSQRLTASQVLDLADREPVRRRFRLDDDDTRAPRGLGRRERHPLGAGRRAPRAVQARRAGRGHVARRAGPAAGRRDDERGRAAAVRRRAAARRRRQRRDRPRRAARRARRPPAGRGRRAARAADRRRRGRRRWRTRPTR